jgi:hypothetical protein
LTCGGGLCGWIFAVVIHSNNPISENLVNILSEATGFMDSRHGCKVFKRLGVHAKRTTVEPILPDRTATTNRTKTISIETDFSSPYLFQ